MAFCNAKRILVIFIFVTGVFVIKNKPKKLIPVLIEKKLPTICDKITADPNFNSNLVVGETWRVYYSWNKKLLDVCVNVTIKYSNTQAVKHVKNSRPLLDFEPKWANSTLFIFISESQQMLLMSDGSGIPGRYIQVPHKEHLVHGVSWPRERDSSVHRIALKLLKDMYLIISDCRANVTYFLVPLSYKRPGWAEIGMAVGPLDYGEGYPACVPEFVKSKDKRIL